MQSFVRVLTSVAVVLLVQVGMVGCAAHDDKHHGDMRDGDGPHTTLLQDDAPQQQNSGTQAGPVIGGVPISVQLASGTGKVDYDGTQQSVSFYVVTEGGGGVGHLSKHAVLDWNFSSSLVNVSWSVDITNGTTVGPYTIFPATLIIPQGVNEDLIVVVGVKNSLGAASYALVVDYVP